MGCTQGKQGTSPVDTSKTSTDPSGGVPTATATGPAEEPAFKLRADSVEPEVLAPSPGLEAGMSTPVKASRPVSATDGLSLDQVHISDTSTGNQLTESALKTFDEKDSIHSAATMDDSNVSVQASLPRPDELPEPCTPDMLPVMSSNFVSHATPPPVPEDLPEVSLMDILTQGKQRITRSRSRRASNTSMASLSAIPENLEIMPFGTTVSRSERADSMRNAMTPFDKSKMPLTEVAELDVDSKSTSMTKHSGRDDSDVSPRSSFSSLLAGDDSIMPVDYEYQMFMPIMPRPRAYWRTHNITDIIRTRSRQLNSALDSSRGVRSDDSSDMAASSVNCAVSESSAAEGPVPASSDATPPATSQQPLLTSPSRPSASASGHLMAYLEDGSAGRVSTDACGLCLLESVVQFEDDNVDEELTANDLKLIPVDCEDPLPCVSVKQERVHQETVKFSLPEAVSGLRCVKQYSVGELNWNQTTLMGDFAAGDHIYQFEESQVPRGKLSLGHYTMKTVFMDSHGAYLWAGMNCFDVIEKEVVQ